MRDIVALASIDISAPPDRVWAVLTDNQLLGEVMFGSTIVTDWKVGGPIVFRGEWEGKPFEDKGVIEEFTEPTRLRMMYFSPLSGAKDIPENYQQVIYDLEPISGGAGTRVTVTQDGNADEEAAEHSQQNWTSALESLQKVAAPE